LARVEAGQPGHDLVEHAGRSQVNQRASALRGNGSWPSQLAAGRAARSVVVIVLATTLIGLLVSAVPHA
jgi:hypothetical protein